MLEHNQNEQENDTDDIVGIVANIKENAQKIERTIGKDLKSLSRLEDKTEENVAKTNTTNAALGELITSASSTTISYWMILILASLAFGGVYFLMKIFPKPA